MTADMERICEVAGDFHAGEAERIYKEGNFEGGILLDYYAYEFYRLCEAVEKLKEQGIKLGGLGISLEQLEKIMEKHWGMPFGYSKKFLHDLCSYFSAVLEEGIEKAVLVCYRAAGLSEMHKAIQEKIRNDLGEQQY